VPGGSASIPWTRPMQFSLMLRDFVNAAIRHVPEKEIEGVTTGHATSTGSVPDARRTISRKEAPSTMAHPAARFEPAVEGHNEPVYRPNSSPTGSKYARGKIPPGTVADIHALVFFLHYFSLKKKPNKQTKKQTTQPLFVFFFLSFFLFFLGQVPHPSMRFNLGDHDSDDEEQQPASPSKGRRFSMPGAQAHPELRFHSEIVEPTPQAPPPVDPSIASHPHRKGRSTPGTVPHPAARSVSPFVHFFHHAWLDFFIFFFFFPLAGLSSAMSPSSL
jgi:hypothetical protein